MNGRVVRSLSPVVAGQNSSARGLGKVGKDEILLGVEIVLSRLVNDSESAPGAQLGDPKSQRILSGALATPPSRSYPGKSPASSMLLA
jgi:hypothetical protein